MNKLQTLSFESHWDNVRMSKKLKELGSRKRDKLHHDFKEIKNSLINLLNNRIENQKTKEFHTNFNISEFSKLGKTVHLSHLSKDCREMLDNASAIIDINIIEDPKYKLVSDKLA